jgi:hypothetical protein
VRHIQKTLEKPEWSIMNGQSRDKGNIGRKTQNKDKQNKNKQTNKNTEWLIRNSPNKTGNERSYTRSVTSPASDIHVNILNFVDVSTYVKWLYISGFKAKQKQINKYIRLMSYIEQNMRNISKYIVSLPFFSSLEFVLSVRLSFCLIFDFMLHRGWGGVLLSGLWIAVLFLLFVCYFCFVL